MPPGRRRLRRRLRLRRPRRTRGTSVAASLLAGCAATISCAAALLGTAPTTRGVVLRLCVGRRRCRRLLLRLRVVAGNTAVVRRLLHIVPVVTLTAVDSACGCDFTRSLANITGALASLARPPRRRGRQRRRPAAPRHGYLAMPTKFSTCVVQCSDLLRESQRTHTLRCELTTTAAARGSAAHNAEGERGQLQSARGAFRSLTGSAGQSGIESDISEKP